MSQFYKGRVTFYYVSSVPLATLDLDGILEECHHGSAVGGSKTVKEGEIDRREADRLAVAFGNDETFFDEKEE